MKKIEQLEREVKEQKIKNEKLKKEVRHAVLDPRQRI
jgi:hypothetical protein